MLQNHQNQTLEQLLSVVQHSWQEVPVSTPPGRRFPAGSETESWDWIWI